MDVLFLWKNGGSMSIFVGDDAHIAPEVPVIAHAYFFEIVPPAGFGPM